MGNQNQTKTPTIRDVAKAAGTAVSTVSYVLNNDPNKYVSQDLRQRVLQAARDLNYHPNLIARSMKGKERRVLAIIVPQFENVFFTKVINGAEHISYENGYMLLFCSTFDDPDREKNFIENLIAQQVDGLLISPTIEGWRNTSIIRERNIPYVVLDRLLEDSEVPYDSVSFDNKEGSYLATRHLIAQGHRKLAYINWDSPFSHLKQRLDGFWKAIDEAGLSRTDCFIISGRHVNAESGYKLAQSLFSQFNPTAVLASHHFFGEGLVNFLRETGRAIPDDISVVVYGQPSWVRLNQPSFTCIQQPAQEIGELGAKILLNRIANPGIPFERFILKPNLIIRDSVKTLAIQ
ncbi:MAG: LacI family DNA-binding transcriptional regulator [Bacteroidota bacterium]